MTYRHRKFEERDLSAQKILKGRESHGKLVRKGVPKVFQVAKMVHTINAYLIEVRMIKYKLKLNSN